MTRYAAFEDIGKRMLLAWNEGVTGLRSKRVYSLQIAEPAQIPNEACAILWRGPLRRAAAHHPVTL
jgi:hypothetical protein